MRHLTVSLGMAAAIAAAVNSASAAVVGHWRMDETGAVAGGTVGTVVNAANPGTINGSGVNNPKFSADVPGAYIHDPVAGTYTANQFSLDAAGANALVRVANHSALDVNVGGDRSFTVEFFIKLVGEPSNYENFVGRMFNGPVSDTQTGSSDRQGWQVDFDHGATSTYGQIRSRWDLPGSPPPDWNNVTSGGHIFVDTDSGSGVRAEYTGADYATNGDGLNDLSAWQHVALTYNDTTRQFRIYLNKTAGSLRTLNGTFEHGPAPLDFGKFSGTGYGLLIDEVRYSSGVLPTSSFLSASAVPEPATMGVAAAGLLMLAFRRPRRRVAR